MSDCQKAVDERNEALTVQVQLAICLSAGVEFKLIQGEDGKVTLRTKNPCAFVWDGERYVVYESYQEGGNEVN